MHIDPYILTFSAVTVIATVFMGFWAARKSKTAGDFFVAGRSVSVGWNASAISGEYLSAASFMGIAGMVMSSGYDALWYPVCYACGYLFLLLFIAGPLRRFGAYTIPDFAEGRFDSPLFRKIAVCFVLFIGFFYTMPQMKGAGTTLAYIFPGLPYWAGVVLVGAVITLNVALGGMKGITLVQAVQYWAKMFAISVPIFVLMAVYGDYGKQLGANGNIQHSTLNTEHRTGATNATTNLSVERSMLNVERSSAPPPLGWYEVSPTARPTNISFLRITRGQAVNWFDELRGKRTYPIPNPARFVEFVENFKVCSDWSGKKYLIAKELVSTNEIKLWSAFLFGAPGRASSMRAWCRANEQAIATNGITIFMPRAEVGLSSISNGPPRFQIGTNPGWEAVSTNRVLLMESDDRIVRIVPVDKLSAYEAAGLLSLNSRRPLPEKAPADSTWLSPFGPLTTKAAKAAAAQLPNEPPSFPEINLKAKYSGRVAQSQTPVTWYSGQTLWAALEFYESLVDRKMQRLFGSREIDTVLVGGDRETFNYIPRVPASLSTNRLDYADAKRQLEVLFATNGMTLVPVEKEYFRSIRTSEAASFRLSNGMLSRTEWVSRNEKKFALFYTYSLIIALVCGTAGLPHILVRFYTNPDGVAAKRTTMWVMILIGIFYVFPPVFGVLGRNLLPELYSGIGAKGTDKIVLELPRLLNEKFAPLGSILSGITCAGAFAAFMSTFSGLLVSMTGALAHDVYGRMLRPKSTPDQRMRMFKVFAVVVGGVAVLLGSFVEPLEINFMVGQAFAIAAASYFPLLFMAVWWRQLTMKGAATGMLVGGLSAVGAISLTSFSVLALAPGPSGELFAVFKPLNTFWAGHPLLRILCEQPALWAVPLAIGLMIVVSKLTRSEVPSDIRLKMLVLHAPEKLGLKQEYIQEHQAGH